MKKIVYYHNTQKKNITLPRVFCDERPKRFFIFGDSYANLPAHDSNSWTIKVCDHFNAASFNWSIAGGSEQSIFYTFMKNINEFRDFTFIFHTHPSRTDKFFNLHGLPMNLDFFKKWDELVTFPCIHLYWSTYNYEFKNGRTLLCTFPEVNGMFINHHMSNEHNALLAETIINTVEDMLHSKK